MNRRAFGIAMAAAGLTAKAHAAPVQVDRVQLERNGWMPNNRYLPVLHYHRAFPRSAEAAAAMETAFERNQWPAQWRNGVFDYHHFHSTAHEVLGIARGRATLMLGGENGHTVQVEAGDVLVLPTGTGHCRLGNDSAFLVVGAYPVGQTWDLCRAAPDAEVLERMRTLPFPKVDPVSGLNGALPQAWRT